MTPAFQELTPEDAVAELKALRTKHGNRAKGQGGLTLKIMAKQIGLKSTVAISYWFTDGESRHKPWGKVLERLCRFLDRCQDKDWLKKLIEPKEK